jgi:hypothetical protein
LTDGRNRIWIQIRIRTNNLRIQIWILEAQKKTDPKDPEYCSLCTHLTGSLEMVKMKRARGHPNASRVHPKNVSTVILSKLFYVKGTVA